MNPIWFLIAYQLGKSSSSCSDRDDTYSSSSLSTSSLDNTVGFFYALLVAWLAFMSAWHFDFHTDAPLLQALILLEPALISLLAVFAYFSFDLTNCSSEKILVGLLLGALALGGLWHLSSIGYLAKLPLGTQLAMAALPSTLMVASNVISHKLSLWLMKKNRSYPTAH